MPFSLLEKVVNDFQEEVDALEHERLSSLRYTLKKVLRSLRLVEDVVWDGYAEDIVLKKEFAEVLTEAEVEIGALLRNKRKNTITPDLHQRMTSFLLRLSGYKEELRPSQSLPRTGSFRIPLFTRSDSFRSVNYEPSQSARSVSGENLKRISVRVERETVEATVHYTRKAPDLTRQSAPPRPPPPPPPGKQRSRAKKKPEITRLPKVVKLFHSFRSRVTETTASKKKLLVTRVEHSDPSAVIKELMSKSKHAKKINEEVEQHQDTIEKWANEIRTIQFTSMEEVVAFVLKMDADMNETLTDEVVILKRVGNWPRRYDVLREASGSWNQLKSLEKTFLDWSFSERRGIERELRRLQDTLDKVEAKMQSMMRRQQEEEPKYREAGIPWTPQLFECIKIAALAPIELHLKKVYTYSSTIKSAEKRRELFSSCALVAFKGHQFVGGFNEACTIAFAQIETAALSVMKGQSQENFNFPLSPKNCVLPQ